MYVLNRGHLNFVLCFVADQVDILEDEALCIPLLYKNLTLETVRRVVAHTSESVGNENCYHEQLPISFVFGVNRCLERFNVVSLYQSCTIAYLH